MKALKAFLLCSLFFLASFTSPKLHAKTYNFVTAEFPKISQTNQQGSLEGLGIEVTQEIFKRLDKKVTIQIVPLKRALFLLKNKEVDGMIGPYLSEERADYLLYNKVVLYNDDIQLYKLKQNKFSWDGNIESLKDQQIGVINGWDIGNDFNDQKDELKITYIKSVEQAFKMLKHQRVDLVICHKRASSPVLKELGLEDEITDIKPAISKKAGHFASAKDPSNEEFLQLFDETFQELIKDGTFDRLNKKWLN